MSAPVFRPTFSIPTTMTDVEFAAKAQRMVGEQNELLEGQIARDHALVSFVQSKRHFWSPWLHLELQKLDADRKIFGRFSPHPSIWTGFMFAYLSLGILTFFATVTGLAQGTLGKSPWAFWGIPVCVLSAATLWLAARAGQQLAREQMDEMTELVRRFLAE